MVTGASHADGGSHGWVAFAHNVTEVVKIAHSPFYFYDVFLLRFY